jgi:hypothetical protein
MGCEMIISPSFSTSIREAALIPLVAPTVPTVRPVALVLLISTSPTASTARALTCVWPRVTPAPEINSNPAAATTSSPVTSFIAPAAVRVALLVTVIFLSILSAPAVSVKVREAALIPLVAPTVPTVKPPALVLLISTAPTAFTARVLTCV